MHAAERLGLVSLRDADRELDDWVVSTGRTFLSPGLVRTKVTLQRTFAATSIRQRTLR